MRSTFPSLFIKGVSVLAFAGIAVLTGCGGGNTSDVVTPGNSQAIATDVPLRPSSSPVATGTPATAPTATPTAAPEATPTTAPEPIPATRPGFTLSRATPISRARQAGGSEGAFQIEGLLTPDSFAGDLDFRYDVYIVTALATGKATIVGDVVSVAPGGYEHGYGFPISMGAIEEGADLRAYGGNYASDALGDGEAITQYDVEEGKQYLLVYKSFKSFTPQTYTLTFSANVRVEGKVDGATFPGGLPGDTGGLITLENPRPERLTNLMGGISPVLQSR